ncbi:MAG: hypothetical protein IM592_16990 [Bacteroidetes bacterium]|nr:hypothetical protein [Bacteroidota bacterium]
MYDFIKSDTKNICIQSFLNNEFLEFQSLVNRKTGEVNENELVANDNGMEFKVINNQHLKFSGSVHKYWNQNKTNYNDYNINDFKLTINRLKDKFDLSPFLCDLRNLEFGVNVSLPFKTETFLNTIISFKGKEYELETFNGYGKMLRFRFNRYYEVKIYDKGLQYNLNENILRFEIKVKKMNYLKSKKIDVKNLHDLTKHDVIESLKNQLLKTFKELLTYDATIKTNEIKKQTDRELLLNGRNPKFWQNLSNKNPNTYKKKRTRFRQLNLIYGKSNIQKTVLALIESKLEQITKNEKKLKSVPDLTMIAKIPTLKCTRFNTSSIVVNQYPYSFGRLSVINY